MPLAKDRGHVKIKKALYFKKKSKSHPVPQNRYRRGIDYDTGSFDLQGLGIKISDFKNAAKKQISSLKIRGLVVHDDKTDPSVEILFKSAKTCDKICRDGIKVKNKLIIGYPNYPPDYHFTYLYFKNLPFIPQEDIKKGLISLLENLGELVEVGILLYNGWFEGVGYAMIISEDAIVPFSEINWPNICKVHVTQESILPYCRNCHLSGHKKDLCPEKPRYPCQFCESDEDLKKKCTFCSFKIDCDNSSSSSNDSSDDSRDNSSDDFSDNSSDDFSDNSSDDSRDNSNDDSSDDSSDSSGDKSSGSSRNNSSFSDSSSDDSSSDSSDDSVEDSSKDTSKVSDKSPSENNSISNTSDNDKDEIDESEYIIIDISKKR